MAEDLNDLFPDPQELPPADSPAPVPAPAPPSYAPSMEGLVQEVGQLKQMVQTLLPVLLQQRTPVASPAPASSPSPDTALSYQDQEYLDEGAAAALLSSPNVRGELNKMLNTTARRVHSTLAGEIGRNRQEVEALRTQSQQAWSQMQVRQQMAQDFSVFYGEHPDLEPHADLVQLEAQRMSQEFNANPYAFTGVTREGVMKALAERTQHRLAGIVASVSGQSGSSPPVPRLPARRTQLERGSGTRIAPAPAPKDANSRELDEMDRFVRG